MFFKTAVCKSSSVGVSFYEAVAGRLAAEHKRLQHRCFSLNIAKILRTAFFYRTPLVAASVKSTTKAPTQHESAHSDIRAILLSYRYKSIDYQSKSIDWFLDKYKIYLILVNWKKFKTMI